ncbi:hypothetical protein EDC62_1564 [Tibeticola sediminis]|jgi:hypothetical protein|uniref:Uncharacterized protein n=1 Tax=Tibeticola sediminis TaxID=1917811 RepID=A0A3N4UK10_9BURK|nr:hypothetical protein [Tibeticola sediminis]RPE67681.1 hypothetical protein EDC62_1564 [Tibeticola sediminis]
MYQGLTLIGPDGQEFFYASDDPASLTPEAARAWLDAAFIELDCEPLRASGKVLLADKVLAIAQAAGSTRWTDPAWGQAFARAACAALGRTRVTVDLRAQSVTF